MTEDRQGFAVHVGELETVANQYLPEVAMGLRRIAHVVPRSVQGRGAFPAVIAMTDALDGFVRAVGHRQGTGCARIGETAEALSDIARLYRRADGQT